MMSRMSGMSGFLVHLNYVRVGVIIKIGIYLDMSDTSVNLKKVVGIPPQRIFQHRGGECLCGQEKYSAA